MKIKNNSHATRWLPFAFNAALSVTILVFLFFTQNADGVICVQILSSMTVPAVIPIAEIISGKKMPMILNTIITVHIFLAILLGSALDFYERFYAWDMLVHCLFGFEAALGISIIMVKNGAQSVGKSLFCTLLSLSVMGCAALWEMFEFVCDRILDADAQRVGESLALGFSPLYDTITDIIVTAVGVFLFFAVILLDKVTGKRLCGLLY
ncbi:MAG: hypothetical protein IJW79_12345 [Clostridia bacterium]|nr:hypothetical protein [Clostridia bacterium]